MVCYAASVWQEPANTPWRFGLQPQRGTVWRGSYLLSSEELKTTKASRRIHLRRPTVSHVAQKRWGCTRRMSRLETQAERVLLDACLLLAHRSRSLARRVGGRAALGEFWGLYRLEISTGKLQHSGLWDVRPGKVFSYQPDTPRPHRTSHPQGDPDPGCPAVVRTRSWRVNMLV